MWLKISWHIIKICVAIFFLVFGIQNMINAYSSETPHWFIVMFFSSSFMILISLTFVIVFVFQILAIVKPPPSPQTDENQKE